MPTYDISGVPVEFPYDAYDCQLAYMGAVVRALEAGENALLESPTGTGKTLCLLCATLGWRRHAEQKMGEARTSWEAQTDPNTASMGSTTPRIWYSSRTHSQIKQVIKELKRTTYRPSTVVLGSREHFCTHSVVSKATGARQNAMCKRARDENKCPFYVGFRKGQGSKLNTNCMDIEETVSACDSAKICGFYKSREDAKDVDLLFIPYDYLINPSTRDSLQVKLKNSILIFDEGHNIEKSCESIASFELSPNDLSGAIAELDDAFALLNEDLGCADALGDHTPNEIMNHLNLFKKNLLGLEDSIYAETLKHDAAADRTMLKEFGSYILQVFARGSDKGEGITAKDMKRISMICLQATRVLTFGNDSTQSGGFYLDKIQAMLVAMFKPEVAELDKNYQVLLYEDSAEKKGHKRKSVDFFDNLGPTTERSEGPRTLCLWCFSCSVAMRDLEAQGVRSLIVTSGTLSPVGGTAEAFGVPFPIVLENSHVINSSRQLWGGVITKGPENVTLNASWGVRDEPVYLQDLGQTVAQFASSVPDGVLLAFQSYAQKESVLKAWRETGIYDEIQKQKPIFEEPTGHGEMKHMMERFNDAVLQLPTPSRPTGGALLMAVCRGKLCEGIDFTDRQCRLVIMVGVPYPSRRDLRVMLKQNFLDTRGTEGDGRNWYVREAIRAVNQTVGRVIRHRNDFGAVVLLDDRYARDGHLAPFAGMLPSWLKSQMAVRTSCSTAVEACRRFFGTHGRDSSIAPVEQPASLRPAATQPSGPVNTSTDQAAPTAIAAGRQEQQVTASTAATSAPTAKPRLPSGVAAAIGGQVLRAVPASSLGALWKQKKRGISLNVNEQQKVATRVATTPAVNPFSRSKFSVSGGDSQTAVATAPAVNPFSRSKLPVSGGDSQTAKPRIAIGGLLASQGQQKTSVAAKVSQPAPPAPKNRSSQAQMATPVRSRCMEGPGAKKWLQAAERLLPKMEFDEMRDNMTSLQELCETIMGDSLRAGSDSTSVEDRLRTSMTSVAETLLPEFSFDTPQDEQCRNSLVKECASLMPKLVQSLWRKCVEELLRSQGKPVFAWGR